LVLVSNDINAAIGRNRLTGFAERARMIPGVG
jgi:hypothetical protein